MRSGIEVVQRYGTEALEETHTHTRNNSRSWYYICSTVNLATPTTSFTSNCSCKSQLHCEQVFVKIPVQILTLLPKTEF
jgi:hypothetical protein